MDPVKVTFNKEVFYIPRNVLEESDFFRGMLLIESDNLVINMDIDMNVFRVFVLMIQNVNISQKLAEMHDMFGFNSAYEDIKSYICAQEDCNKIAFSGRYCVVHKCMFSDCGEDRCDGYDYCRMHKCLASYCKEKNSDEHNIRGYCSIHIKCKVASCANNRKMTYIKTKDYGYCCDHSCREFDCEKFKWYSNGFCIEHGIRKS